jgi:predicted amidohydrolase
LRVAAVQLNSTAEKAANLEVADRLTRAAAAEGARLIVLPEKWTALGTDEDLRAGAEPLDGPAISWARELARELTIDLVAGSILERLAGGTGATTASRAPLAVTAAGRAPLAAAAGRAPLARSQGRERLANTSVHIDPRGEIRAAYRKLHMFDVEVEGRAYCESAVTTPGEEIVLSATAEGVGLGLSICYDLRFPELYRILALRGARVFALPAAFTLPTTRDHWDTLVRARAIENQAFVIAANQVGAHPGGHRSGGRSMIVDPWGVVLAEAADGEGRIAVEAAGGEGHIAAETAGGKGGTAGKHVNGEGYITAELDFERQQQIRTRFPALANRRPQAYRWPAGITP